MKRLACLLLLLVQTVWAWTPDGWMKQRFSFQRNVAVDPVVDSKPPDSKRPDFLKRIQTVFLGTSEEALASEGPWKAYLDEQRTGLIYYYNEVTGASQWKPPTSTFPAIQLSQEKQQVAQKKRQEFLATGSNPKEQELDATDRNEILVDKPQGENWFANLLQPLRIKTVKVTQALAVEGDWAAFRDDQGSVYYFNKQTGQSQWNAPTKTFPLVVDAKSTVTPPRALALHGDWTAYFDADDTRMVYYYNVKTGASQWERPTETFPPIRIAPRMKQRMLARHPVQAVVKSASTSPPLAVQGNWEAYSLNGSDVIYYKNKRTCSLQWEKPTADFPTVQVPSKKQPGFLTWLLDAIKGVFEDHNTKTTETKQNPFGFLDSIVKFISNLQSPVHQQTNQPLPSQQKPEKTQITNQFWMGNVFPKKPMDEKPAAQMDHKPKPKAGIFW